MNSKEFRTAGHEMIDYVATYMDTIRERDCMPNAQPGYLAKIMPTSAPEEKEEWADIMKDLEPLVMEGTIHWNHPHFHAYFPNCNSWSSVLGDVLSNATGINAFSWESCPAATELEIIVLDWVAKFTGLPDFFLSHVSNPKSVGGGVIQGSGSECVLVSMIAARELGLKKLRKLFPSKPRAVLLGMLVGYTTNQSHSCVGKAAMISGVCLRSLRPGERGGISATTLKSAIREDEAKGLFPFFLYSVLGSTGVCAFDDLMEIGPICYDYSMWLHVDGAYAGSSFACPEMRYLMKGMEYAWSFEINAHKWMLTNFDCSIQWFKYKYLIADPMSGNDESIHNNPMVDFRHWGIPMSRRFRAIKLWMVIRNYGVEGIRKHVRLHIYLAKLFEKYVLQDPRFEIPIPTVVGLTSFRLIGPDESTGELLLALNTSRKIHMVPTIHRGQFLIRFAMCAEQINDEDIKYAWDLISEHATQLIKEYKKDSLNSRIYAQLINAQDEVEKAFARKEENEWDRELANLAAKSFSTVKTLRDLGEVDILVRKTSIVDDTFSGDGEGEGEGENEIEPKPDGGNSKLKSMCVIA